MVALLLVVVWLVALVPLVIRKFGERSDGAYVERFRGRTQAMSRVTPACAREGAAAMGGGSSLSAETARLAKRQRQEWQHARRQIERRRCTLAVLLGGFFLALTVGIILDSSPILYVALVFAAMCAAYITLLVRFAQRTRLAISGRDQPTNIVPIRPDLDDAQYGSLTPMRPAFVVVDVRA